MTLSESKYGITIAKDVMVPMRDGVRLATDIYRPAIDGEAEAGNFPTILGRTSYDKTSPWMWVEPVADFFTPRGYVVVLQDLRGRHRSEGKGQYFHTVNVNEGPDGYDTVEWIAAQPWSSGKVGMVGSSHGAIVQSLAALYRPPHLTALWQDVGPTNFYAHCAREGGAFALHALGMLFLHGHDAQEVLDDPVARQVVMEGMVRTRELLFATPFKPGYTPLTVIPNLEKTLFDYYYHGEYDDFWAQDCCDQERYFDQHADLPSVYSGGWYDGFAPATTNYFTVMARQNKTPQRLVMGPWTHFTMRGPGYSFNGDVDFGSSSVWGDQVYNEERRRWFDRWLKGAATGVDDEPPVRIFVMGGGNGRRNSEGRLNHGGFWRTEQEWPLARTEYTPYYLHNDGRLHTGLPEEDAAPLSYTYDPDHPVPTISSSAIFYEMVPIGEGMNLDYTPPRARMRHLITVGAAHQEEGPEIVAAEPPYLPLAARADVLVFQTTPLAQAVEVTGPITVKLWIASSAMDTDFTAKLLDIYPPNADYPTGYHLGLCDSIIRTRYRNSWEQAEMMEPDQVYPVEITLPPISNLFQVGHRIRIDISSSNFPRFDVNPNTGEAMGRHTYTLKARNSVYLDADHPSHIVLPIIP